MLYYIKQFLIEKAVQQTLLFDTNFLIPSSWEVSIKEQKPEPKLALCVTIFLWQDFEFEK